MLRAIAVIAFTLAVMSGIVSAMKKMTPASPAAYSDRHACAPDRVSGCDAHGS